MAPGSIEEVGGVVQGQEDGVWSSGCARRQRQVPVEGVAEVRGEGLGELQQGGWDECFSIFIYGVGVTLVDDDGSEIADR